MIERDELAERRAIKANDSTLWSPRDALLAVVKDIDDGKMKVSKLSIHFYEDQPDGSITHHYCVSGLKYHDHVALLEVAKHQLIHDWMK